MNVLIADWLAAPGLTAALAALWCVLTRHREQADALFAIACGIACLAAALYGQWLGVVLNGVAALLFIRDWWKRRKRRRNVLKPRSRSSPSAPVRPPSRARCSAPSPREVPGERC